jgi:3-phenylpropionate/cinnamic acid dioxygenase small subunit
MSVMTTVSADYSHQGLSSEARIRAGDPVHGELHDFLNDEAALLDNERLTEWLGTLAEDLVYRAPVRVTRLRAEGRGFSAGTAHFDETYASLVRRVSRATDSINAWAVDPPARVQRHISNVRAYRTQDPEEFRVLSYLLAVRSQSDVPTLEIVSAERDDLVRRTTGGWRLARRDIYLAQSTLGVPNLAFFL